MGVLSAVHLAADHFLRILHRNAALGIAHEDDEADHRKEQHQHEQHKQDILDAINAFDITSKLPSEVSIGAEFLKWLNSLPSKPLDSRTFAWPGAYEPVK